MNTRTVKTKDEVIKALNCCTKAYGCDECPYTNVPNCHVVSKQDAIHYICEDSDDKKATVAVISDEERRLRKAVIAQQQTINALLGL